MSDSSPPPLGSSEDGIGWYEPFTSDLEQGDILVDFPCLKIDHSNGEIQVLSSQGFAVVLTQTCDIQKPAQRDLLLAAAYPYAEIRESASHLRSSEGRKALQRGSAVAELLLPPAAGAFADYLIVVFRDLFVIPKDFVIDNASDESVRLASPYKEYLSQGYARFVMRVGLPTNIKDFA